MASATKQALLAALSAAQGECISGQQLAQQLGVSRAAVHKAAAALAAQGYALEAAPRRGYRLAGGDPFCAEAVGEYDAPIYLYDKLESSNRTAKTLALEGTPHGTMVLTSQQTAGRGRLGRRFESPAGKGIYLSLVLRPGLPMTEAQAVTVSAAVAVCRAVKRLCGLDLGIKWVNDLYYNGKKVCGILTEMSTEIDYINHVVIGVGINVNLWEFPEEMQDKATSLAMESGQEYDRNQIIGLVMKHFEEDYERFIQTCDFENLLEEYHRILANLNQPVRVLNGADSFEGVSRGIDTKGELLVEKADGTVTKISAGEVSVRGLYSYV